MFRIITLLAILALVSSSPFIRDPPKNVYNLDETIIVPIVRSAEERKSDGSFAFMYEGADGNYREESGTYRHDGTDGEGLEIKGSYRYIDADGKLVEVQYTAGRNGFIPFGTNIPLEISSAARAAAEHADYERAHPLDRTRIANIVLRN